MLALLRYITLVLTLSALLTLYLTLLITVPVDQAGTESLTLRSSVKEVVAYSLRKQIEIESEEVSCKKFIREEDQRVNFVQEVQIPKFVQEEKLITQVPDLEQEEGLWTRVPGTNLFVFGVYYDDRLEPFRYLRLLGMIKGTSNQTLYCQTQFKNDAYHVTKAVQTDIWVKEWDVGDEDTFNPILISCYLPTASKPRRLSISTSPCKLSPISFKITTSSTNKIKTSLKKRPKKYLMTVCVKPLDFTKDISTRLMQWIEMNKILGADRFEIFVRKVPEKVLRTLKFYAYKHKGNFLVRRYQNVEEFFRRKLNGNKLEMERMQDHHLGGLDNGPKRLELIKQKRKLNGSELERQRMQNKIDYPSDDELKVQSMENGMNHPLDDLVKRPKRLEIIRQEERSAASKTSVEKKRQSHNESIAGDVGIAASKTVNNSEASKRKIWQKRRNELMAYNDCLYRNLRSSHFVIPVDIDEIIVPRRFYTWEEALGHLFASAPRLEDEFASFSAQNAYFLEEFSKKPPDEPAFFFDYTLRSEFSEEGESGKSFVSTKNTLTVFNHYALEALKPGVRKTHFLPRELVQMNHYKRTCSVNLLPQCAKYLSSPVRIVDTLISKYKREFMENYRRIQGEFDVFSRKQRFNRTAAS